MHLYDDLSYDMSRMLTLRYSSSFGMSSRLFARKLRKHIYAIYGIVRLADEVVDSYRGPDAKERLDNLEKDINHTILSGYSTNPIVHSFANTARKYGITSELIEPFFKSMRMDLSPQNYSDTRYNEYIHGSAEVVGLMCLRVFCENNDDQYQSMEEGARALGAAYQKVNFLRDIAADTQELGRMYFPDMHFDKFNESDKQTIVDDIQFDIAKAKIDLSKLPRSSRLAVMVSSSYYSTLLNLLDKTPVEVVKTSRLRISGQVKLWLLVKTVAVEGFKK